MNDEASDEEILSHVITFEPPPPEFNPLTASHRLLRKYGYPHRPDPNKEPRLSKLWQETLSRPHRVITPEFEVDHSKAPRVSFGLQGQWAGAEVFRVRLGLPPSELITSVYARWFVPAVRLPDPDVAVGFWVGLGGDQSLGSTQLIQAGTDARPLSGSSSPAYRAWFQWPPLQTSAITVKNFPISPGDQVGVLLIALQPNSAFISMFNFNTSSAISFANAPSGANADGSSAEWVVEANGNLLADFTEVVFSDCVGSTKNNEFGLGLAYPQQIISQNNPSVVLANPIILPPFDGVQVNWLNAGP
jgi:Peptidase A4 family